jgi:signal transduction histidine kinase
MVTSERTVAAAGTSLATSAAVPENRPSADWRGRRNRYFVEEATKMTKFAMGVGLIVHAAMLAILGAGGLPLWRVGAVAGLFCAFGALQRSFRDRTTDPRCVEGALIVINIAAQLFVIGSATLTGGLHSPFLPDLVLPAIVSLLFFGPVPTSRWIALSNALLIFAMLLLPVSIVGAPIGDAYYIAGVVISLGWSLVMLHMMAGKLAVAAIRAGDSYDCLREERVADVEAQLRRLQGVGAKVAHELKNPLASIKGLCQLVSRAPESERTQERLAVVASEIERMQTILDEYLSFSRPLEDIKPEKVDLTAIARDVSDVLAGRADAAGVTLAIDGGPTPVQGDPRRLKEALINLVANAIEATPNGGKVALRLRTGNGEVTLDVKDSGRGIAPEDLERLGTSFFTTRANGTGLGVVLAQGVITQHGGTLTYASTVGQGTTATIRLPGKAMPESTPRTAMIEARI